MTHDTRTQPTTHHATPPPPGPPQLFAKRLNIPRLIRACEEQQHWRELVYLYIQV
jgi:hypothetical protein